MASNPYAKLQSLKHQVAAIEAKLAKSSRKLLAAPGKYGFKSMAAFIAALQQAAGAKGTAATKSAGATPSGRKPRAKITPETKAKVKALAKDGKTGGEIAQALNISLPSVQNIKKELGLVKARK